MGALRVTSQGSQRRLGTLYSAGNTMVLPLCLQLMMRSGYTYSSVSAHDLEAGGLRSEACRIYFISQGVTEEVLLPGSVRDIC